MRRSDLRPAPAGCPAARRAAGRARARAAGLVAGLVAGLAVGPSVAGANPTAPAVPVAPAPAAVPVRSPAPSTLPVVPAPSTAPVSVPVALAPPGITLLVGGYGTEGVVRIDGTSGRARVLLKMTAPTAMLSDPRRGLVYVTSELSGDRINLRVLSRAGREVARAWSGGRAPVALALDATRTRLAVANYDGSVAVLALDRAGLPSGAPVVVPVTGRGPDPVRQTHAAHPHGVEFSADGRQLYVADLGGDQLLRFTVGVTNPPVLQLVQTLAMTPGSGPRHIRIAGSTALVTSELDAHVDELSVAADGALVPRSRLALGAGAPSDVAVHPGGRWAVVLHRGPDQCVAVPLGPGAAGPTAPVTPVVSACPGFPRAALWGPDGRLYVAAQKAGEVDAYGFDPGAGVLSPAGAVARVTGAAAVALP